MAAHGRGCNLALPHCMTNLLTLWRSISRSRILRSLVPHYAVSLFLLQLDSGPRTSLELHHFPPGSAMFIEVTLSERSQAALEVLNGIKKEVFTDVLKEFAFEHFSYLLFFCDAEERQILPSVRSFSLQRAWSSNKRSVYVVPGLEPFKYAGIAGVCVVLESIRSIISLIQSISELTHLQSLQ